MDERTKDQLEQVCRTVLAPLVAIDGGQLDVLRFEGDDVHIHLSGQCAGCPGAAITASKIILPALRAASSKVRLVLTTGHRPASRNFDR